MGIQNKSRPIVVQTFTNYALIVGTVPTPVASNPALINAYIDSFIVSVPVNVSNSVFFGDSNVTITNGVEIPPGNAPNFRINNERQLYELQDLLMTLCNYVGCQTPEAFMIPYPVWDLSQLYMIAAANTSIAIMTFKTVYV